MAMFGTLSDEIFRPLAAQTRWFYADLLIHLHTVTFDLVAEVPRKGDVLSAVREFLDGWEGRFGAVEEEEDADVAAPDKASSVFRRLVSTGWLVERRDRYIRYVDFDPDSRTLVEDLDRIRRGERRSYGGAVLDVLTMLESAAALPDDRSESIRNAAASARAFSSHLRMVGSAVRKLEDRILSEGRQHRIFKTYFEDFVEKFLIADYRSLRTRNNPFRFRMSILREIDRIEADALLMRQLALAYVREDRAADAVDADIAIRREFGEIRRVFEQVDEHLDAIEDVILRLERKIANTIRFSDMRKEGSVDRLVSAFQALSRRDDEIVGRANPLAFPSLPIGLQHTLAPRRPRDEIAQSSVAIAVVDQRMEAWKRAKQDYLQRTSVSEGRVRAYLDLVMAGHADRRGSELPIADIDEFIVFQRLREVPFMFEGRLSGQFAIEMLDGRVRNEWIECRDFRIRRVSAKSSEARHAA